MNVFYQTTNQFEKKIEKFDKEVRERIIKKITQLKEDPYRNTKKLHGKLKGMRSLRIGEHRVIFSLDETKCIVFLLALGHRRRVYNR